MLQTLTWPLSRPRRSHCALLRGAVRPGLGLDPAAAPALEAVVADGRGGPQALLEVARLEHAPLAGGVVAPHAGEAVGLQLQAHRQLVGLASVPPAAAAPHLVVDAEQVLHVVADLVRDDVGLGEVAGRAEAPFQLVVEAEVDVDLAGRAGSRTAPPPTGRCRRPTAPRP